MGGLPWWVRSRLFDMYGRYCGIVLLEGGSVVLAWINKRPCLVSDTSALSISSQPCSLILSLVLLH